MNILIIITHRNNNNKLFKKINNDFLFNMFFPVAKGHLLWRDENLYIFLILIHFYCYYYIICNFNNNYFVVFMYYTNTISKKNTKKDKTEYNFCSCSTRYLTLLRFPQQEWKLFVMLCAKTSSYIVITLYTDGILGCVYVRFQITGSAL